MENADTVLSSALVTYRNFPIGSTAGAHAAWPDGTFAATDDNAPFAPIENTETDPSPRLVTKRNLPPGSTASLVGEGPAAKGEPGISVRVPDCGSVENAQTELVAKSLARY